MKEKSKGSQLNLWISEEIRIKLVKMHEDFMKKHEVKISLPGFVRSLLEKQLNKDEK